MQNSKDEFLKKLNILTDKLNEDSKEFVSKLCENLVEEFEFESVVIFKILNDNNQQFPEQWTPNRCSIGMQII